MRKKLPIGIENFEKLRTFDFYYVDKTNFIRDLLLNWGEVNLFTRPRRFGKSLNMNLLKNFFQIGCDKTLFDGLNISKEKKLCDEYMGKFPVISISLKDVSALAFEDAYTSICSMIGRTAMKFPFLEESERLTEIQKKAYCALVKMEENGNFIMSNNAAEKSLQTLSELLHVHYGKKVILLIDEYDVPLDKAFEAGYYREMVLFIRNLFSNVLKSNEHLQFAVLTGCLRIAKESIFTGLNNFNVFSIMDIQFCEYFGFTDTEVKEMLAYYGLDNYYDTIKKWYDGYKFGNTSVYCPWDVIKYCQALLVDKNAIPEDYWSNTSSNNIVRRFIDKSDKKTKDEIEQLISGKTIVKTIKQELTYNELDSTIDNLWSVLLTTGYLTQRRRVERKEYELAIPNLEICELFVSQIKEWFSETTRQDKIKLEDFCRAFQKKEVQKIEQLFTAYLKKTISIRDTNVRKVKKENFYHGILLGLLSSMEDWLVLSNAESGEGYSDILIEIDEEDIGIVIEIKYGENGALEAGCAHALEQIEKNNYAERLYEDGMTTIIKYGISCFKKRCKVVIGEK
jgi:hypothetical protein